MAEYRPQYSLPNGTIPPNRDGYIGSDGKLVDNALPDRLSPSAIASMVASAVASSGGGGGGASPEQVKTIMAETLMPGDGIAITPAQSGQKLEVKSTVGVTTSVRPWAAADLLYATPFDAGMPSWVSTSIASGTGGTVTSLGAIRPMSDSLGASKPAYANILLAPAGSGTAFNTQNTVLQLDAIPAVVGKSITRIVLRHSLQRTGTAGGFGTSTISVGGVQRVSKTDPGSNAATAWETLDIATSSAAITATVVRNSSAALTAPSGWLLTGLEIYGLPAPWMLNNVAAYQGQLWRSMQDNNPYTPGSGQGWQAV